ncbi:fatty acyl-AMP ligase [Candidatus Microthrix sp.]|uniref:fatty acyl-AMP ligase n=1 Tax=Candidatus Neomicrothrix sp. TaxID=2719034 RepID=UPI001B4DA544|nr:fatty acyl-AMP ligase [Candidatus Microthrix sp.]MBP7594638.1 fatty acyl-AMP ligase [Candidatus Microthrix sp.]HMS47080.1 fatty acyl-AMP ligase [Candidatus Microthrix sp.]
MFVDLVDMVRSRADSQGDETVFRFLLDGEADELPFSYGELDRQARALAVRLQQEGRPGDRVVILMAPGAEFVVAFVACMYSGLIAVPAFLPDVMNAERSVPRLRAIAQDAEAVCILTDELFATFREQLWSVAPDLARTPWLLAGEAIRTGDPEAWSDPGLGGEAIAFIQYTSGSTALPKGVVLTHGNLLANSEVIKSKCFVDGEFSGVSWLPPYHDMGLIGGVLQPLYQGRPMVLMSPMDFLARPLRWLQAITKYSATVSPAPNFAFELCVRRIAPEQREGLDLSSWRVAFNGAEPIRPSTLERFEEAFGPYGWRGQTMLPCYGLAESTLIVSGHGPELPAVVTPFDRDALGKGEARPAAETETVERLVACGGTEPLHDIRIVDPDSAVELDDGEIGEIWLSGPSVGRGYWGRRRQTREIFEARLDSGEGPFLRTGDLGFFHDGELYVAGRIKDLIIVRGRNLYPQDIEGLVEKVPGVRAGCVAAFAVAADDGATDALAVVAEVDEAKLGDPSAAAVAIRSAVTEHYQVAPAVVTLIRPRSLAKTSSGKVQRHAAKRALEEGALDAVLAWPPESDR